MDHIITNQAEWIHKYNDEHRPQFNDDLFVRDDYEVIEALKNVILSCQRDKYFTIKVMNFTVVEDYEQIYNILFDYEQKKIDRNKNNSKKIENPYKFINIKDTDMMLLIVDYYISVNDPNNFKEDTLQVIIEVPRIVDKYYYKISGNYYSAIYQIVDGSTYNNTTSNSKKQSVTFKTLFMPIRLYRNQHEDSDINYEPVHFTSYTSRIFNKNVPIMEYFLAKFGLYGAIDYLGLSGSLFICGEMDGVDSSDRYCFNESDVYIYTPKVLFDNDIVLQCFIYTILKNLKYNLTVNSKVLVPGYNSIMNINYWLISLATRFNSNPMVDKGLSILNSLESIYDIETKKSLRLDPWDKEDIYSILRWMTREFPNLRLKDNADISIKKIRRPEYIASIYATKISKGIYIASDNKRQIKVEDIKKYIRVEPDFLISAIIKDKLVPFMNTVNDNDAFTALKFSFKGRSGLGEQVNSTIPDSYRQLHPSSLMHIDPDTSSASDPGLTGIICPMAQIYNGFFAPPEYIEHSDWEKNFKEMVDRYYQIRGKKNIIEFQDNMGITKKDKKEQDILEYCVEQQENALKAFKESDATSEYHEGSIALDGSLIIWDD